MDSSQDNRGPELIAVTVTLLTVTWISVTLRFIVRIWITRAFKADDWAMAVSQLIYTVFGAFVFADVHWGVGRHEASLSPYEVIQSNKYLVLGTIIYVPNVAIIKLSIVLFLLRIAVKRLHKIILIVSITIVVISTLAIWLLLIFLCNPITIRWDPSVSGTCLPPNVFVVGGYVFSIIAIISDWLYALIPIHMLWNVKMNRNTKIAVIFVLSLGILASIATLIRIRFLILTSGNADVVYTSTDALIWTVVEPGLAITAASAVTLRPLLLTLKVPGFSSSDNSGPYQNTVGHETRTRFSRWTRRGTSGNGDPEALGATGEPASASHDMNVLHAPPSAMTTTVPNASGVGAGVSEKQITSATARRFPEGDRESQEIILSPRAWRDAPSTEGLRGHARVSADSDNQETFG